MLLACVGLTVNAQTPTVVSGSPTSVSLTSDARTYVMASSATTDYYFNGVSAKTQGIANLGTGNLVEISLDNGSCKIKDGNGDYVRVFKNKVVFEMGEEDKNYYNSFSVYSNETTPVGYAFYQGDIERYFVTNGNNVTAAGAGSSRSYWFLYLAKKVRIKYSGTTVADQTHVYRVGDVVSAPTIDGYTVTDASKSHTVTATDTEITFTYTADGGGGTATGTEYTVSCATENGGVTFGDGTYKNSGTFTTDATLNAENLTAIQLTNKLPKITVTGTTVTVKYYDIYSLNYLETKSKQYLQLNSNYTEANTVNASPVTSTESEATSFVLESNGWTLSIANADKSYYLTYSTTKDAVGSVMKWNSSLSTTAVSPWRIEESGDADYPYYIVTNEGLSKDKYVFAQTSPSYAFIDGTTANKTNGYYWRFVNAVTYEGTSDITYNYLYNGASVGTETIKGVANGSAYPTPNLKPLAMVADAYQNVPTPTGVVTETKTVDINVTLQNFPFEFAATYDNITTWYNVKLNSNATHYMYYDVENTTQNVQFADAVVAESTTYRWGFVGDPVNGFKLYNEYAGNTVALDNSNPSVLAAESQAWKVFVGAITSGFCLSSDNGTTYLNYQDGGVKRYGTADAGSTFVLTESLLPIDALLAEVNACKGTDPFFFDETVAQPLIDALTANRTVANYEALKAAFNDLRNFVALPSGRYFIRNKNYSTSDESAYLLSLTNPMANTFEAMNYWGIWQIDRQDDGTYHIMNEGNRYILTPTTLIEDKTRDNLALLHYDPTKTKTGYAVGDLGDKGDNGDLVLTLGKRLFSDVDKKFVAISGSPVKDMYMCMDLKNESYKNEFGVETHEDRNAKSCDINVVGEACLWEFIEVDKAREAEMFKRNVDELAGYVGGVVTLSDVQSVESLQSIVKFSNEAYEAIKTGGSVFGLVSDGGAITLGAQMYGEICFKIALIKDSNESGYYQGLVANRPFFLETVCGSRPHYGYRLTSGATAGWPNAAGSTGFDGWIISKTAPNDANDKKNNKMLFYATPTSYEYEKVINGNTIKGYYKYTLRNGEGKYIAKSGALTASTGASIPTTDADEAMEFVIDPVIPGVWQIRDIDAETWGDYVYQTISNSGTNYGMIRYFTSEASTLFRFKTYNTLETSMNMGKDLSENKVSSTGFQSTGLDGDTKVMVETPYITSFSHLFTSSLSTVVTTKDSKNLLYSPYRVDPKVDFTGAYPVVTLREVPNIDGKRYLMPNTGYIILGSHDATVLNKDGLLIIEGTTRVKDSDKVEEGEDDLSADYFTHNNVNEAKGNALLPNLHAYTVETDDQYYNMYVLNYVATDAVVGTWQGQDVYGVGTGFYHLKRGKTLAANKAYLPLEAVQNTVSTSSQHRAATAEVQSIGLRFVNEQGVTTNISAPVIEDNDDAATDMNIYDLSGRVVSTPQKGQIYILNGKKVLF